jgi:CDP-diglyceride synthetase
MKRLFTALALVVVAGYLVGWAPQPLFIGASLVMCLLCYWEYSQLVAAHSIPRPGVFGLLAGLMILFFPQHIKDIYFWELGRRH